MRTTSSSPPRRERRSAPRASCSPPAAAACPRPDRTAEGTCAPAAVAPATPGPRLSRAARRALAVAAAEMTVPIDGDRGYAFAEVTAGGVPLRELHLDTLRSRRCPGLSLCGEICDVDGRIGGVHFPWGRARGLLEGTAAPFPSPWSSHSTPKYTIRAPSRMQNGRRSRSDHA